MEQKRERDKAGNTETEEKKDSLLLGCRDCVATERQNTKRTDTESWFQHIDYAFARIGTGKGQPVRGNSPKKRSASQLVPTPQGLATYADQTMRGLCVLTEDIGQRRKSGST